jgi:cellobiose epimerase
MRSERRRARFDPTGIGTRLHELAGSGALEHTRFLEIGGMLREQVEDQILPSWCRITLDRRYGGFRFGDVSPFRSGRPPRRRFPGKHVVSQSRMVWNLAHAHRHGFRPKGHDLLARATSGYQFLQRHLRDPVHGGYYWRVSRSGEVDEPVKALYGQAFVIFAFVELSRASRDPAPLDDALTLWRAVMEHLHDATYGGWTEHALPDWSFLGPGRKAPISVAGHKSANAHLHWMEALVELAAESNDGAVVDSLGEAVDVLTTHFHPTDPAAARSIVTRDWQFASDADQTPISLGHNVEFAWLLLRAEQVLARPLSIDRLTAYVDHALKVGFDGTNGGLDDVPASVASQPEHRSRIWWVQAEFLASLAEAAARTTQGGRYDDLLRRQLTFVLGRQADPHDGLWWEAVDEEGRITNPSKHHEWKAGYHELRAIILLSESMRRGALSER